MALSAQAEAVKALMAAGVRAGNVEEAMALIDVNSSDTADTIKSKVAEARVELGKAAFEAGRARARAEREADPRVHMFSRFGPAGVSPPAA